MRKMAVIFITLTFMLSFGAAWSVDNAGAVPSAVVPEQVHTFAPVIEGDTVLHDFVIKNDGSEELVVNKVETG